MYDTPVALIMEVSHGCQLKCHGCRVDIESTSMPDEATLQRLAGMYAEFETQGLKYAEIELGPTDLMSASNRDEIFGSETLHDLADRFIVTALAASFIHPDEKDYIRFANQVHQLTPKNVIGLAIPVEMSQVFNDKYIGRLQNNIEVFRQALPQSNQLNEVILSVIFDERFLTNVGSKYNYEDLFSRLHDLRVAHNTKVDFVFHHGRDGRFSDHWVSQDFLKTFRELNRQYLRDLRKRAGNMEARHMPFQLMCDARGGEIVYHDKELYLRPVLNERVMIFDDSMRLKGPWTAENYFFQMATILNRNLDLAAEFDDCSTCDHQAVCAERAVQDVMRLAGTKNCITLLKNHGGVAAIVDDSDFSKLALG